MADMTPNEFMKMLQKCINEYKKQLKETRDDSDACHYFSKPLLNFMLAHKSEFDILATMNFDKSFMSWLKNYVYAVKTTLKHD